MGWRGALAILFGVLALSGSPGTVRAVSIALGAYAALESMAALGSALALASRPLLLVSIVDSAAGGYLLLLPAESATVLAWVLGAWATASGILDLLAAEPFGSPAGLGRAHAGAGAVALFLGVALAVHPEFDRFELAAWCGSALIVRGALFLVAAGRAGDARPRVAPAAIRRTA
jgi:uncharacterized membrane protein HdeD (DUF308 family)